MKIWCNIQVIINLFQAVHSDEKKFKCSCGFSTKFSSHLAEHKRTHEGKVHRCTLEGCQYWTAKKTLLNAHMRMHNGEKKFVCKVCSKGFVEAGQLRRHEKIHTNDKKFVCDVENCSYSSTRKVIFHPLILNKHTLSEDRDYLTLKTLSTNTIHTEMNKEPRVYCGRFSLTLIKYFS